ncbi:MAG: hypothetical protein EBR82_42275 [Caulobacteraceae bacterium]|nr:hypothetical protein [Caulobacteraceae bacterium]
MADAIIGASKELKLLQGALENVASKQIAMGALVDANNAEALVGKTGDERQRMQIQLDAKAKRERAKNETTSVQDRDSAIADINREEAAKLKDLDMQKAKKAKEDEEKLREGALKTLDQIFKVEEKIRQGRMKEPELAEELIKKYEELNGMQELFASFGSAEGAKQAAQFGLEAAQIKEQLAGLGQGTTSQEIIADSIQRVGGGGRSAIIGGQGQIDYLKRLNDTGDKQYKTLMTIANNTSPSDRGMAGAQ